jgi:membrane-bound metal-dependent hydrolase YbcI (DUF457 family)
MAQAGLHALIGLGVCRWTPQRTWLALGLVLGNMLPDADILAMAVATVGGLPSEGLHRTFTHSLFTVAILLPAFRVVAWATGRRQWWNLGLGLGLGMLMHIALDLAIWFRGVQILWPLPLQVDFWRNVAVPGWWSTFELPAEFLCFALLFLTLHGLARRHGTDLAFLRRLRFWIFVQSVLFVSLAVLAFALGEGYRVVHGAFYLPSLGLAIGVVIRMRGTLEGRTPRA